MSASRSGRGSGTCSSAHLRATSTSIGMILEASLVSTSPSSHRLRMAPWTASRHQARRPSTYCSNVATYSHSLINGRSNPLWRMELSDRQISHTVKYTVSDERIAACIMQSAWSKCFAVSLSISIRQRGASRRQQLPSDRENGFTTRMPSSVMPSCRSSLRNTVAPAQSARRRNCRPR